MAKEHARLIHGGDVNTLCTIVRHCCRYLGYREGITAASNGLRGVWYGNATALWIAATLAIVQVVRIDWGRLVSVSASTSASAAADQEVGERTALLVQMADVTE